MSYTKGELVLSALNEIGISDYDFDIGPEQTESAMRRLDSMMGQWDSKGIKLGYPIPSTANGSSLDQDSNIPDVAWEAAILNLAIRLMPSYGKQPNQMTLILAKNALNTLYAISSPVPEMQLNQLPKGAGHKSEYPFTSLPSDKLKDGDSAELDLEGVFDVEYDQ